MQYKTAGAAHKPSGKTDRDNPQRDHIPREYPSVFLLADQEIAGMLTVGIYHSPTGGKAWIEDVVMDENTGDKDSANSWSPTLSGL